MDSKIDKNIGIRVKELREAKGITQEALAEQLGFTRSAWKAREDGASDFKSGLIVTLSEIFGVSTDYILKGQSEKETNKTQGDRNAFLRRKVCQMINRETHRNKMVTPFSQGFVAGLGRVVHLIDKMKDPGTVADAAVDDYDQRRHTGLLEED